jgi:hypothetical protein
MAVDYRSDESFGHVAWLRLDAGDLNLLTLLPNLVKQSRRNYSIPPYASGYVPTDSFRRDAPKPC